MLHKLHQWQLAIPQPTADTLAAATTTGAQGYMLGDIYGKVWLGTSYLIYRTN